MPDFAATRQPLPATSDGMTTVSLPAPSPLTRALPYLALAGSISSFCIGTSFAKRLFPLVGAEGTAAYRVGFAAIILLIINRPWQTPIARPALLATMRYGAVLGLMNLSFYMALRTIPLGLAIAIEFLGPLTVSVLHSHRPAHFAAVGLAAVGLALLLPLHPGHGGLDPVGIGFALGAGLFWGLYIVCGRAVRAVPSRQAVAIGMATAAAIVVPVGIHAQGAVLLSPSLMLMGLVPALLSSSIPYSLEMMALRHIPPNRFGVLMSAEPAVGALAGALMLGERLSAQQVLAVALVVSASIVAVLAADRR